MAQYVVTADDRSWFGRCRRAWDLGAGRPPEPRAGGRPRCPSAPERAIRDALAVHYFPGMWSWDRTIVDPLVLAAYDRAHGPRAHAPAGRGLPAAWAAGVDRFTPLRVEVDIDVHVPDPVLPDTHLATPDGAAVAVPRPHRPRAGRRRRPLLARRPPGGRRVRRRRRVAARRARRPRVLGVGRDRVGDARSPGIQYTEIRLDPPAFRRTRGAADRGREGGRGEPARARRCWRCSRPTS